MTSAFQRLSEGLSIAATSAGMPAQGPSTHPARRKHCPFFDAECVLLKRQLRRTQGPHRRVLEAQYHATVRHNKRAYKLARLKTLLDEQYNDPRSFWKLLRSEHSELPLAIQQVQSWDVYVQALANCGSPSGIHLPPAAYPHFPVDAGTCMNEPLLQDEVQEALQKLHNGRAKGSDGMPAEFLRYAKKKYKKGRAQAAAPSGSTTDNSSELCVPPRCCPHHFELQLDHSSLQEGGPI